MDRKDFGSHPHVTLWVGIGFDCAQIQTGAAAGCDTLVRRFFSVQTSGVHLTVCSVPTPTPSSIVTPTPGGTCFCWSPSLTAMSVEAYPSAADDEAVMVKVVAGSGGSRASGSHGPLDLDPAPCGGAKSGCKGKGFFPLGMELQLSRFEHGTCTA